MQKQVRFLPLGLALTALIAMLALFVQIGAPQPVAAQTGPTPTPQDQLWLAFSAARDAIEEKFNVDLTFVRSWEWFQTEWTGAGIDSCLTLEDPTAYRPLYFGWTFLITALNGRQFEGRSSFDSTIVTACDTVTVGSAAPTPAPGAVDPNLPPPVAGSANVNGFVLGGHVLELNANTVSLMRRAGMTIVKKQFRYVLGQDPSAVAGLIQSARANGFRIVLGIVGDPAQMGNFDSYVSTYASFVAGVARQMQAGDAIEVWNEPNIDREWPAGQINGANYTRLLAAAYNAIKSANPGVIVISGAPAPTGFFGAAGCAPQGCNDDAFMQQMAAAGAAQYMDCVGLHYNEGIIPPSATSGDPRGSYPTYFFQSMINRGYSPFGGRPVCFTELGYLSPQGFQTPLPGAFAWAQNVTVAQQAAWLAEAATIAANSGRVAMMIVWNVDFPFFTATDPMGGYAMFRPDGSCPACDTLGAVMRR
ncbi:MAG: hypothetical protein ACUVS2_07235 [Candidatus Flexifilum sp.]